MHASPIVMAMALCEAAAKAKVQTSAGHEVAPDAKNSTPAFFRNICAFFSRGSLKKQAEALEAGVGHTKLVRQ